MKTALLVLCRYSHKWMTPEGAYGIKVGFADAEFTPIKFV